MVLSKQEKLNKILQLVEAMGIKQLSEEVDILKESVKAIAVKTSETIDAVNQFYERLELSIKQLLSSKKDDLKLTSGQSAHLITSIMEGVISRFIRNKFKEIPSNYIENYWTAISTSIFKI